MMLAVLAVGMLIQAPSQPTTPASPPAAAPACVTVSKEKVRPPRKIHDSHPDWSELQKLGVVRAVPLIFDAVIGPDGDVTSVKPLRSRRRQRPDPRLEKLFGDAIRKWKFEPTTVDGQPVAVCMTVTVNIDV